MSTLTVIPSWLDEKFIEQALRSAEGDEIKVNRIQVRRATVPGDNYSSVMYRVAADYNTGNGHDAKSGVKSLIVKAFPEDEYLKELMTKNEAFTTEIEVLSKLIPAFHRLLNVSPSDKTILLGPRSYLFTCKPHQKLVMEDLCQDSFRMAPRLLGLDLAHSKLAVSHLGIFHAASVALHHQKPEMFESFLTHIYIKNGETMKNFLAQSFNSIADKVRSWPEVGGMYSAKLQNVVETASERLKKAVERDEQGFNVLVHGDAWTNNMLFKYSEVGEVSDITFVDFQCAYYGSPTIDLLYFLYTSPSTEVRSRYMDYLLKYYHSSLSKTLAKLGCEHKCPSLDEIRTELKNRNFMAIFAVFCVKPLTSAKPDNVPDLSKLTKEPSQTASYVHLTEEFCKEIKTLLPIFDEEGLFEP